MTSPINKIFKYKLRVVEQGAPAVLPIYTVQHMVRRGRGMALATVELRSLGVTSWSMKDSPAPRIALQASEWAFGLHSKKNPIEVTTIEFPQFTGWEVACTETSCFSTTVCLVKQF